jgi:hypothetical protein
MVWRMSLPSAALQATAYRFTASSFQLIPHPGRAGMTARPSRIWMGSVITGAAQSTYSSQ